MINSAQVPFFAARNGELDVDSEAPETIYSHLGEVESAPTESIYGEASGKDLMLARGSGRRPWLEMPASGKGVQPAEASSHQEQVNVPKAQADGRDWEEGKRRYANRPQAPLPVPKQDVEPLYETIAPPKPMRARDDDAAPAARMPPPLPMKPPKIDNALHGGLESRQKMAKRPPATLPKPLSPPRSPPHASPEQGSVTGPQLPSAIAAAAAARARQRTES